MLYLTHRISTFKKLSLDFSKWSANHKVTTPIKLLANVKQKCIYYIQYRSLQAIIDKVSTWKNLPKHHLDAILPLPSPEKTTPCNRRCSADCCIWCDFFWSKPSEVTQMVQGAETIVLIFNNSGSDFSHKSLFSIIQTLFVLGDVHQKYSSYHRHIYNNATSSCGWCENPPAHFNGLVHPSSSQNGESLQRQFP